MRDTVQSTVRASVFASRSCRPPRHILQQKMTLGQQHSKGELGGVGFSIDDLIDGTKDALAGIVEPFRVHDMRPVPIEPCAVTGGQGTVSLALNRRRFNGDLSLGLHELPFSRGLRSSCRR